MADNFTANFLAELKKRNKQLTYTKKDDEDDKKKEGSRASGSSSGTKITPSDSTTKKTATTATAKSSSDSFTQNFLSELERRSAPVVSDNAATRVSAPSYQDTTNHAKKNASGLEIARNALTSGLGQFNRSLTSTLDFVLPTELIFGEEKDPISRLSRYYSDAGDRADKALSESVADRSRAVQITTELGKSTVSTIPQAVLALMTGGSSVAAQGGTMAANTSGSLASSVGNAARSLLKNPSYWMSAAQTIGPDYEEAKANGASDLAATASAIISGALNAGIEVGGGLEMLPSLFRRGGNRAIAQWVKSALEEGQEEVVQGVVSGIVNKATYDSDRSWFSLDDDKAIINPGRMAEEFGMGAAVGGILGGAQIGAMSAINAGINRANTRNTENLGSDYQVAATKTIEEGLSFPPETEAHRVAQEVMEKLSRDGSVSDYDLGRVVVATERTMRQQEAQAQPAVTDEETLQLARETVAAQQNVPQAASQTESVDTKAVPLNVMSMESPEVQAKLARKANTAKWTGYGDAGVKAFDEVVEKSGQTREAVRTVFQSAYETGLAGVELEHVKDSIVSDVQRSAYLAGREDHVAGLGRKASTNVSGKAGFDTKGLPKDVADWEVKAIDTMARELGVSVSMTDDDGYNGRITGSGVLLSTTFQREFDGKKVGLLFHGAHEIGVHRVLQLAPKEGRAFVNAMYRYLTKDAPATDATLAEKKQAHYGAHDVELSTADAMEELAANAVIQLYGNDPKAYADAVERVLSGKDEQAKKGLAKFKEVLGEIVQKIRRAISKLTGRELQEAQRDLSEIEKLRDLLETAMKAAQAQAKAAQAEQKNTAQTDGGMMSLKTVGGKQVVWIENSALTNKELKSHTAVADYLALHIGEVYTLIESGQKVYIGEDLPGEYTQSKYTTNILKRRPQTLKAKNKVVGELGLLIETATNRRWEKTRHTHNKDAKYGIYRYDSTFAFPIIDRNDKVTNVHAYDVELLIRNASDGKKYLYDLVNIKENTASAIDLLQRETRRGDHEAATRGSASTNNDTTKSGIVKENPQYSFKIDTDGMSDEAKEIIGNLKRQTMFSKYTREGKFVSFTSDRIEREIRKSVYYGDTDAARSHIVWMDPLDFIYATTTSSEMRDNLKSEAGALDLEQLRSEDQPIYLHVNMETGEIVGHEGRHRMLALRDAGAEKVAVIIYWSGTDNRDMQPIRYKRLTGQTFGGPTRGAGFTLTDALPLSARYADAARQLFSEVGGSVKFSFKENESVQYSLVEDEETLDFLNQQEWVTVYRAMYQDETGLYPPMGAIQGGKRVAPVEFHTWYQADEHPELIKFEVPARYLKGELNSKGQPRKSSRFLTEEEVEANRKVLYDSHKPNDVIRLSSGATIPYKDLKSKFELVKADGGTDVPAAYNPYFHTSLSALNDQFSTAYKRPGLVVVEGYIPKSELTSGYKALYAKDPVGETTWKSGVVATNLKGDKARKVYLSRWFRAERVVSDDEAAGMIAKVLEGENLRVPWNVVTPALRNALEQSGVDIDYDYVYSGTSFEDFQKSGERYSLRDNAVKTGDEGAVYEENGRKYSLKSLKHDITERKMFDDLVAAKVFNDKEVELFRENLEKLISYMLPNASILDMNEAYGKDDRPFGVYKPNSDPLYGISLDFSTLCRKRLMTQYVIEQLQLRENRPMSAEEQIAIRSMLLDYRRSEKALQVACAMCYVEAARLKAPKQMEKFFNETESIMRKHFAKKDKDFNAKVMEAQKRFKVNHGYKEDATKKDMKPKDVNALNDMSARMRKEYTPDAKQQAIIDKAVSLPRSTFLTAANLTALSIDHPEIYSAYTDHIRASTRSKSLEGDVPYYYGDSVGPVSDRFIESVNAENGMRFDSWSDFQMKHMLDMITAVIDLSVRGSKMHGYTKFPEMVRIFGKTGMMFNLSGVTEGNGFDENGNLVFSATESIDFGEAVKLRRDFPETAGLQCIGVSNDHIRALLRSDEIDYVIPYHTSGMNATLRRMAGINQWKDYTSTQNAKPDPKAKKPADAENWQVEPVWSEFYVAEGENGYDIMQKTAQRYIDMCHERGLIPKFDEFTDEDGYWKLLVDRKMINQITGEIIEQKPVRPDFDFDLIKQEIDREVSSYDPALEQKALKYVVDNFDAVHQRIRDLKKNHPKKAMANMANEILQAYAAGTNEKKQFSLKDDGKLERENARLKEVNQNLREQFKRTKFAKVDKKSLDVFTKKLLKDYKSGADINDVREALDAVYTYMGNGDRDGQPPVWDDLMQKAYVVAQNILTNVVELDTEMYDEYKSLRDYLRTTGISISRDYEHDLGPYENLAEFRRANMGRIKIVNDGLPIDRAFQELSDKYPGFFDEYDTTNPADQLLRLEEVLDSLQPVERNPYTHDMRNHATWLANDILERFFELPQAKPTYADKAAKKLADTKYAERRKTVELREAKDARIHELIEEKRKEVREAALGERMASGREIAKLKRAYEEKEAKASETRRSSGLRGRIERHAAEMSQKLLKPDDKHHVPQELRAPVAALLDAINLESQYTIDPETGKRVKNGGGDPVKRSQAFNNLRVAYQKIIEEDSADIVVDPAITAMLDRVSELREVKLAEMSYSELETIWQVLRVVEHTVNNAGKLLSQEKYERTTEWAEAFVDDTETRRTKRGGKLEGLRLDLENPYTFFNHYGDAGHAVYRMLRDAQDKQQLMTGNVAEAVEKIVDPKTVRKLEKEVHEIKTERGVKLVLTKAQIMDIYLLTKRQQAQEHLMQGGIVQPEVESRHIKRGTDAVLLSYNDLQAIVGKMTVEDRKIAIRLQELTKTTLANYGNAASLKAYGYKKFTGEDYWPIKSAKEGVHSNVEKGAGNTRSIKNIGLAKTVMPHANNPLDIGGIFKTFASHSADMIDYAAWLCPMEDANRLFNFQFRDEGGLRTGKTIKGLLDSYGGRGSQEYWHRLMEDIQNGIKAQNDSSLMQPINKVIGNVRGASVGANLRVIIQQPTAILRAAMVLSPADMAAGMVGGGGWKAALRHSAIAQRKDMVGFDISSPAQMQEILFDSKTKLARFNEAMMWGAGKADAATWGRIWSACEAAVKRKNKDIKPKSEAFYEAVDALFTEVIDQTQVVDGVLQRSQAMRSSNALLNQATAFMGEPTMAMNMLLRVYDGLVGEQDSKKRGAALRKFGRAATVLLITNTVNALAQSIIDAARDDEDEEYWNKFWTAFSGLSGEEESTWQKAVAFVFGGNLGSSVNPATYVPFAKDLISILSGYDVTRADADAMKDIVDAGKMFYDSIAGNKKRTVGYAVKNLAQQVGKVFGISAPNLLRDVWGITRTIALETGNIPLQYEMEKAIYNVEGEGNVSRFVDILYKAYTGDQATYRHIYADLKAGGFDMDKIQSAMESRMKKAQGVTKVDDLDQRYLTPEQQTAYDKKVKSISKSDLWKSAKTSQRDELKGSLYDLTVMNGDGEKLKEKIDEGRGYGIDETEYLLYTMALDMADTPNKNGKLGGTPTNAEKADAISMVGGLSDSEIAFLWDTEQGYEAYAAGIDMKVYVDVLGEGGSVNVEKLVDAKAYDISEEAYFDFLDSLKEHDQPSESGKLGTFTQSEATAAIAAMPGLTDAQRAYLWQSVNKSWKENKNPWR